MCCRIVQCGAVWCSVLQSVAVCCSVLQCVAVCCSVLQCDTVRCSIVQCCVLCCSAAACCSYLQAEQVCAFGVRRVNSISIWLFELHFVLFKLVSVYKWYVNMCTYAKYKSKFTLGALIPFLFGFSSLYLCFLKSSLYTYKHLYICLYMS